jgi:predicted  nucleic acid-binding Zn-ribbon protein
MSNILNNCDYVCQQKESINELRRQYNRELINYSAIYDRYVQFRYDKSTDKTWKVNYANNTLLPLLRKSNDNLENILNRLRDNVKTTNEQIKKQEREVDTKNKLIEEKVSLIEKQKQSIQKVKGELVSKDRQVNFTMERTRHRKRVIIAMILLNTTIATLFYYKFMQE